MQYHPNIVFKKASIFPMGEGWCGQDREITNQTQYSLS